VQRGEKEEEEELRPRMAHGPRKERGLTPSHVLTIVKRGIFMNGKKQKTETRKLSSLDPNTHGKRRRGKRGVSDGSYSQA